MAVSLTSEPIKTLDGVVSNANAARTQLPFLFTCTDFADKTNYKIRIRILAPDNSLLYPVAVNYSPSPSDGTLFIDFGPILVQLHERDKAYSIQFKVEYTETYEGFTGAPAQSSDIQSIYAIHGFADASGSNLRKYLADTVAPGAQLTKFSGCGFIWPNTKKTVNILIDDDIATRITEAIEMHVTEVDINSNPIKAPVVTAIDVSSPGIQQLRIDQPGYDPTTYFVKVEFKTATSGDDVWQANFYELREICQSPVFVEWVSILGGLEQHIFDINQTVSRQAVVSPTWQKSVRQDIADVTRLKENTGRDFYQIVTGYEEGITLKQYEGLADILTTNDLNALSDPDGNRKTGLVVINPSPTIRETRDTFYDFSVDMEYPLNTTVKVLDFLDPNDWILATGFWNMSGIWINSQPWNYSTT